MMQKKPYLIEFKSIGEVELGYISVCEFTNTALPFIPQRIYWTYHTPEHTVRGRHAHRITEQIIVAVAGKIIVRSELLHSAEVLTFVLDKPHIGLYLPSQTWNTIQYSQQAVQIVLASATYNEQDYIRNYNEFKKLDKV